MKRILLLAFLLVGCVSAASAQANLSNNPQAAAARRGFRSNGAENSGFGIKGGVNFSQLMGDGAKSLYNNLDGLTQYHFGAYAQVGVSNWFSVQPEILYQRKGYSGTMNSSDPNAQKQTTKLSYLSAPVLLVFNVFNNVGIQIGPQFSYLLNVREGSQQVDASKYRYNQFDVGAVGGIEAKLEFLRIGARYDYSLTDLRKSGDFNVNQVAAQIKSGINTGTFQVYLGVGL